MEMDIKKIKLIIWDLDDTFWNGTISEGKIEHIEQNISLVKALAYRGIISSICSKNDMDVVVDELSKFDLMRFFVFPSINWEPKGPRVKEIIDNMQLRDENVLFLDDNVRNLAEVNHFCPNIMVSLPEGIQLLIDGVNIIGKDDHDLSRLKQYQLLEKKKIDMDHSTDENAFLKKSNIKVGIYQDCEQNKDRLIELINRSNQLNYTKKRISDDEFFAIVVRPRNWTYSN